MMNDDFQHRVSLYLDNELNQEEQRHLLEEINNNENYQSLLLRGQSFKSYIKSHVTRPDVSPSLIRSIKEKIRVSPS
jgi:hypothetical protein